MSNRHKNYKSALLLLIPLAIGIAIWLFAQNHNLVVFNPKGIIAASERSLIITFILLMLIVVIPVFAVTFFITTKYREGNKSAYAPNQNHSAKLELAWWMIPAVIVVVLAVLTWKSTHKLDPFKPIDSNTAPITIQVVALQWKWLFIYPEQNIATVNFIQFPANTPINFELTADAPMNSFWIPQLGGQMYAMPGMGTHLHLMASEPGDFTGSAAEISGRGFSGMKFTARASSEQDFEAWVKSVKQSPNTINFAVYNKLAEPSEDNPVTFYASSETNLYDRIMMKFTMPMEDTK